MGAKGTVRRLPADVQEEIMNDLLEGATIVELQQKVKDRCDIDISQSAMGRFAHSARPTIEKVFEARKVAKAMAEDLGADDGSMNQGIINILQSLILDIVQKTMAEGEIDTSEILKLTRAVRELSVASKSNVDAVRAAREEGRQQAREEIAQELSENKSELGITNKTADKIKEMLGRK